MKTSQRKLTYLLISLMVFSLNIIIFISYITYRVVKEGGIYQLIILLILIGFTCGVCLYLTSRYTKRYFVEKVNKARSQSVVGKLANAVAHQIRNPLNNLSSSIYLLKDLISDKNPDIERHIKDIESELNRANRIINNFLNFSRPSKGMTEEDVNLIINQTLELVRETISSQGITIKTQFNPNLPKMTIDVGRIKEVFLNIVLNAQEAMTKGGCLTVTTNLTKDYVQIAFADTGVGIPKENIEAVFDPYYTTKKKGMGLGLSIVQRVIEDHHGSIGIESKVGEGTTVKINLPINKRGEV